MIPTLFLVPVYAVPLTLAIGGWAWLHRARTRRNRGLLAQNRAAGLAEPPGLHPVIDAARCIGCGACVRACPEHDVLGLVGRVATLIEPWACVGHGTCHDACPTGAIRLVFGTLARGIDVPVLCAGGETSVAGIHIAGELGGLGLIRNAMNQGREAIDHIAAALQHEPASDPDQFDIVIVGCGPAGLAAALGAIAQGLRHVAIDQATLGGSVAHYPRGKLVMTAPATLPLIGEVRLGTISKEGLLAFWQDVIARTGLAPRYEERVLAIEHEPAGGLVVVSDKARYRTRRVLLAMGRGGTPRRLDVPGEDLAKVVYRLSDPGQYAGRQVMVVGGGDSALEAAIALAEIPGTVVTLVHRGSAFARAGAENRAALAHADAIRVHLGATAVSITSDTVVIANTMGTQVIANDAVIVCAGGTLPREWLGQLGIAVETHYGHAR